MINTLCPVLKTWSSPVALCESGYGNFRQRTDHALLFFNMNAQWQTHMGQVSAPRLLCRFMLVIGEEAYADSTHSPSPLTCLQGRLSKARRYKILQLISKRVWIPWVCKDFPQRFFVPSLSSPTHSCLSSFTSPAFLSFTLSIHHDPSQQLLVIGDHATSRSTSTAA